MEVKNNNIKFSDIKAINEEKGDKIIFTLNDGSISENINSCQRFGDPSYDAVFKSIFLNGKIMDELNGNERLLDLLNSLLFPNDNEDKFSKLNYISNESPMVSKKKGELRFDIACQATFTKKKNKTINIEMQLGHDTNIISRLFKYGSSLYEENEKDTIVLCFINHSKLSNTFQSQYINLISNTPTGEKIKKYDYCEIIIINLLQELKNISEGKKVYVKQKTLNKAGECWLKFLGIRNFEKLKNSVFYYLPNNIEFPSKEMKSAYSIVRAIKEQDLKELKKNEEYNRRLQEEIKEEGRKEGREEGRKEQSLKSLVNIFNQNKKNLENMITLVDTENTIFEYENIKSMFIENQKCDEFIEILGKKRKIIYKDK